MALPTPQTREERRIGGNPAPKKPKPNPAAEPPRVWPLWALKYRHEAEAKIKRLEDRVRELEGSIMQQQKHQRALTTMDRRVSLYGTEQVLQEMVIQVALSPKFKDLEPAEQRYVAMVGLVTGLTPEFYLHAWAQKKSYKDETGSWQKKRVLTVMPDYKALIARSRPLMEKARRLTKDEMQARGIPEQDIEEGSIAYMIEGYELDQAIKCRQAGIPYEPKTGFGWWAAKKEITKKGGVKERVDNDVPNGRDGDWVAEKRARRDLYNQFADLTINLPGIAGAQIQDGDSYVIESGDIIEGSYTAPEIDPADWLSESGIARAEAYRDEKQVTDEQINTWLKVEDWRKAPISADEFKIAVDQIALNQQRTEPAPEPAEEPEPKPAANKTASKPADAAPKCTNCGLGPQTQDGPFPTLCTKCANVQADSDAAQNS